MDINKALKKQKKSYKRFMLSMGFIFILLPMVLFYSKKFNIFFIIYLLVTEFLIFQAMLIRYNENYLEFEQRDDRLFIETGILKIKYNIIIDKIAIVHAIPSDKYFNIMIITKSKFRNKRIYQIGPKFLRKQRTVAKYYSRVRFLEEDHIFYFIIRKGGIKKYILLEYLYKRCVNTVFTDSAVEIIKECRR